MNDGLENDDRAVIHESSRETTTRRRMTRAMTTRAMRAMTTRAMTTRAMTTNATVATAMGMLSYAENAWRRGARVDAR